jgi:hypothetical protein
MRRQCFASILPFLLASVPALAEPATPDGAKALGQSFAAYFGRPAIDQGIIAVAPQGEDYKVTVDLQRVIDGLGAPPGSIKLDALAFLTSPQQGGTWKVSANGFPNGSLHLTLPDGEYSGSLALSGYKFTGVYDPKLAIFLNANNTIDLIDVKWTAKDADVSLQETGSVVDFQGSDAGSGAANGKMHHSVKGLVETVKVTPKVDKPTSSPGAGMSMTYKLGSLTSDGTIDAIRGRSMLDLWAYLVGLQGIGHAIEHQDELKSRITSILPLWNQMKVALAVNGMSVQLPFGAVGLKTLTEKVAMSGLTPHGEFEIGLGFDGLTLPAALLPPWAGPLLPTLLDSDFKLSVDGLDQLVRTAIADFDMKANAPLSPENEAKLAGMWFAGKPKLVIAPSRIVSPNYTLSVQGELALTMPKPTGKFTVSADGLDKTMSVVQAAAQSNPQLQQALPILTFIKGLAKTGADGKPSWEIALGPDGAVTVNGQKMGP